eukprot:PRCOL_00001306-RA
MALSEQLEAEVEAFIQTLKRKRSSSSVDVAKRTANLIRQAISQHRRIAGSNELEAFRALLETVRTLGRRLTSARPQEVVPGNVARRVLSIIREEDLQLQMDTEGGEGDEDGESDEDEDATGDDDGGDGAGGGSSGQGHGNGGSRRVQWSAPSGGTSGGQGAQTQLLRPPSLHSLLDVSGSPATHGMRGGKGPWELKLRVIEAVNEMIDELDGVPQQIAEQALEHIHTDEVILTLGYSRATSLFLRAAGKKRDFQVVVAEGAPLCSGRRMARELSGAGIQTTFITDATVFAMMARSNMVVVGASAVMANGGVMAPAGLHMVALAAQRHAVPFVVLFGMHKLSPLLQPNEDMLAGDLRAPAEVLSAEVLSECAQGGGRCHVVNNEFDYIPPDLITLFLTDTGGHTPSDIYRMLSEYYSPDEMQEL